MLEEESKSMGQSNQTTNSGGRSIPSCFLPAFSPFVDFNPAKEPNTSAH